MGDIEKYGLTDEERSVVIQRDTTLWCPTKGEFLDEVGLVISKAQIEKLLRIQREGLKDVWEEAWLICQDIRTEGLSETDATDQILNLLSPLLDEARREERERIEETLTNLKNKGKLHITPESLDELMGIDSSKDLFPYSFEG